MLDCLDGHVKAVLYLAPRLDIDTMAAYPIILLVSSNPVVADVHLAVHAVP